MALASEELLATLGDGLDIAVGKGDLPNPGVKGLALSNGADSGAYIKAVRSRLIELGYLGKDSKNRHNTQTDMAFKKAVKRFQRDVNLPDIDGWAGPKTWQVMQCLISFEEEQEPEQWRLLCTLEESPAIARAVYLRLYVMGFFSDWKSDVLNATRDINLATNSRFLAAYHRFADFLIDAGLYTGGKPNTIELAIIKCLFNYDTLTTAIANQAGLLNLYPQSTEAIARIELWLHGYDVVPGADVTFKRKKTGGSPARNRNRWVTVSKTAEAIKQFWQDHPSFGVSDNQVSPALFNAFAHLLETEADEDIEDTVTEKMNGLMQNEEQKNTIAEQFKQLANGIWDGFKRLTKWLARMFKASIDIAKNLSFNLVRFIARKARCFFIDVVKAVEIVSASLHYAKGGVFTLAKQQVFISHDKDFDHAMLLNMPANNAALKATLSEYTYRSRCYVAGTRIVAYLVSLFKTVLKVAVSAWGWLQALLALMKLSQNIKGIRREIDTIRDYEMNTNHPNAVFTHAIS